MQRINKTTEIKCIFRERSLVTDMAYYLRYTMRAIIKTSVRCTLKNVHDRRIKSASMSNERTQWRYYFMDVSCIMKIVNYDEWILPTALVTGTTFFMTPIR